MWYDKYDHTCDFSEMQSDIFSILATVLSSPTPYQCCSVHANQAACRLHITQCQLYKFNLLKNTKTRPKCRQTAALSC